MSYANIKQHRKTTKERIIFSLGGECVICGYQKCIKALEVHHIDPNEKEFTFSKDMLCHSWEKLSEELKKCVLLCANCHREVHDNMLTNDFKTSFVEENASKISQKIEDIKNGVGKTCVDCGKSIGPKATRCQECSYIYRRKINNTSKENKKTLTRELLKEKIRTMSFLQIGREFNVSDAAIRKWCIKFNLPSKKYQINSYSDEEWLNI